MAKRKHIGTVILTILVAALLASGVSGWLFWQSVQRVIGEAQQAGEYAAEAQQSVGQGDFKQALEQMDSVIGLIAGMDFPADDHAAVEVHDQVQIKPLPLHLGGQVGHVPAPYLAWAGGNVCAWRTSRLWRLAAAPMGVLAVSAQDALEA